MHDKRHYFTDLMLFPEPWFLLRLNKCKWSGEQIKLAAMHAATTKARTYAWCFLIKSINDLGDFEFRPPAGGSFCRIFDVCSTLWLIGEWSIRFLTDWQGSAAFRTAQWHWHTGWMKKTCQYDFINSTQPVVIAAWYKLLCVCLVFWCECLVRKKHIPSS
jgi:hypothetical protein